jgi:predicted nucleic acid-binding Zn ribbon protein
MNESYMPSKDEVFYSEMKQEFKRDMRRMFYLFIVIMAILLIVWLFGRW